MVGLPFLPEVIHYLEFVGECLSEASLPMLQKDGFYPFLMTSIISSYFLLQA